jgi:predicted helicase
MCVIGNPPYSGESMNKNAWITELMEDYKKEPEGKEKLKEKNPKWLNDDYVKFLRYAQHYIERNGSGIVAFINPHGYLDNPTFRGMRWNLLKTYDKIYILDLHGNSKKKEISPDGSPDQNVFDIMQGVTINIFVKTGKKKTTDLAKVYHYDLFGKRQTKYDFLLNHRLKTVPFKTLKPQAPMYYMVQKNLEEQKEYDKGFSLNDLFLLKSVGVVTARDEFAIQFSKENMKKTIETFLNLDNETARKQFNLGEDARDWKIAFAKKDLQEHYPNKGHLTKIAYRPFDYRWTFYTGRSRGFQCMPREEVMQHFIKGENIALITVRRIKLGTHLGFFISNEITDDAFSGMSSSVVCPLYVYHEDGRLPNFSLEIIEKIAKNIGLSFVKEVKEDELTEGVFTPKNILDYIYAVLHSPNYREKYKEFLKIDFPRVPFPTVENWSKLVKIGSELRQLHLLEHEELDDFVTKYPINGNNTVEKLTFKDNKVFINATQYFENVSETAWNFYIGGYQPAQKWLKDRKNRVLSFEDIFHYQRIIKALNETERLMREIDAAVLF